MITPVTKIKKWLFTSSAECYVILTSLVTSEMQENHSQRFNDKVIQQLVAMDWWDWSFEKITQNASAIACGDLELLAANHST